MCEGIQLTVAQALGDLERSVRDGKYGTGDDFDADAFDEDLQEIMNWTE